MASSAPSTRDIEELKQAIAEERKRVDGLIVRINEVLQHAKHEDDRIEGVIAALAGRIDSVARSVRA